MFPDIVPESHQSAVNVTGIVFYPRCRLHIFFVTAAEPAAEAPCHFRVGEGTFSQNGLHSVVKVPFVCHMTLAVIAELRIVGAGERVAQVMDPETRLIPPENGVAESVLEKRDDLPPPDPETVPQGPVINVVAHIGKFVEIGHDTADLKGQFLYPGYRQILCHALCVLPVINRSHRITLKLCIFRLIFTQIGKLIHTSVVNAFWAEM